MTTLLTLRRSELLADVADAAFVVADVEKDSVNAHRLHQTFDVCEEGNLHATNRLIDLAFSEAALKLLPLSGGYKPQYGSEFLRLHLRLPASVRHHLEEPLHRAVHEYIVARTLEERLAVTLPASRPEWERKSLSLSTLISTLVARAISRHPFRRRLPPFP